MESGPKNRGKAPKKGEKEEEEEGGGGGGGVALKKEIGLLSACGIIVGNIIGSGIFVAPRGVLAHAGAVGPALLIWGLSGAVTAVGALCYAELGVALPRPGGDYAYVAHAFGPLAAEHHRLGHFRGSAGGAGARGGRGAGAAHLGALGGRHGRGRALLRRAGRGAAAARRRLRLRGARLRPAGRGTSSARAFSWLRGGCWRTRGPWGRRCSSGGSRGPSRPWARSATPSWAWRCRGPAATTPTWRTPSARWPRNIIGSGIFVAPRGVLAHAGAVGPALLIWGLSGAVTAVGALCYAELGVALPRPGGDYAYVAHAFGPLAAFLRLWISVLVIYPTNQAVIALTFANYVLQPLFPTCGTPEAAQRILAAACLLLLTWVNCSSVRWATRVQDAFTAGKLLALGLIVGAGAVLIARGEHRWLQPAQAFRAWAPAAAGPLFLACLQGSFAYGGWNFLNYVTEELQRPQRNLPLAISISLPLVTFLYVAANVAYLAAMSPQEILDSDAVAVSFGERVLGPLAWVMPVAVALSTFGGVNGSLFTCSRLFYAGAREGHLPALLAMIHLRRRTPVPALLVTCVSTLLMLVTGDIYTLINYVGFVNYLWYGVTVAGLVLLRWREPHLPRPIKVNLLLPALYLLFWGALLLFSVWSEPLVCGIGLAIMATGAPVYLLCVRGGPRPPALRRAVASLTRFGQRLLLVVYPGGGGGAEDDPSPFQDPPKAPSPPSDRP